MKNKIYVIGVGNVIKDKWEQAIQILQDNENIFPFDKKMTMDEKRHLIYKNIKVFTDLTGKHKTDVRTIFNQ